jgi:hypothetical protein
MAWTAGAFGANTAGLLVAELDILLPANPHWSIYDTPAANVRVYECIDVAAVCLFYIYVDNTVAAIGTVQLWEGWNAGAHVGVGAFLTVIGTSASLKMTYGAGGYGISVRDHCFIWQDYVGSRGTYIGQPRRKDTTLNIVVYCGSGGTPGANALGMSGTVVATAWASLFDELGNKVPVGYSGANGGNAFIVKTILGELELRETPLSTNTTTRMILGELEGVCSYGGGGIAGIATGDTCLMPGGNTWRAILNTYLTFVEEA